MRSPAFRFAIGAAAWIAIGVAAFLLLTSEQRIQDLSASARTFDQHAREAIDVLGDARMAQQAYVAAGQGIGFWMSKFTADSETADPALAALRASASAPAVAPLDQAIESTQQFGKVERRVREYLKTGQQLMAGDVIFTEGTQAATAAMRQIETARQVHAQSVGSAIDAVRKQQAIALAAAGSVAALIVLVLAFKPRTKEDAVETSLSIAPNGPIVAQSTAAPAVPESTNTDTFKAAATLATDFGRVRDLDDLTHVLGRAAEVMDASGMMVWMGATGGGELRPVLAHGYSAAMLAQMQPVSRGANNAAAAAYRSGTLQIVLSRPGASNGALVAPILSPSGCIGALSAEIRHGAETSEMTQALATIFAAHLATVVAQAPADAEEARAAQA
jgi:hypothetical protein